MNVPSHQHARIQTNAHAALWYHVPFAMLTHTYPVAIQQGVADLCLYQLQCTCKCMAIPVYY